MNLSYYGVGSNNSENLLNKLLGKYSRVKRTGIKKDGNNCLHFIYVFQKQQSFQNRMKSQSEQGQYYLLTDKV